MRWHNRLLVAAILVPFCFQAANAGIILTVAGNGENTADGVPATEAFLAYPAGSAFDSAGNLYIADKENQRIRKVAAGTGIISTVAGTGTHGYNGDDIAATEAYLYFPNSITFDGQGNLYIADSSNSRIRKVDAVTGLISTVAGTGANGYNGDGIAAVNAYLRYPSWIAIDGAGDLYIADTGNNRIRKVTATTGLISTVAGTGAYGYNGDGIAATDANIYYPRSVALDGQGDFYIAEDHRIRKVDSVTGLISTVAGTGTNGYNGDGILATNAQLNFPHCVAFGASGNLYIADMNNHRIRKVNAVTGLISTVAGTGTLGYNGDGIYATSADLYRPAGIALDSSDNIYIGDSSNNRLRKVTASTGLISTIAGNGVLAYGGDGGAATNALLYRPSGVVIDRSNNFYIADTYNQRIRKVNAVTGLINTVAGTGTNGYNGDDIVATSAQLNLPYGVALDRSDNLYIADYSNNRIRKVDAVTGLISTVAGTGTAGYNGDGVYATSAQLYRPTGIAFDSSDNLYIADHYNARIRRVDAITGLISTVAGTGDDDYNGEDIPATEASLDEPWAVALDVQGNLYIADMDNNRVRKVDAVSGLISTVAGVGEWGYNGDGIAAVIAKLNWPKGIVLDKQGNIYIADEYNDRIRKVDAATGLISTVAGTGSGGYNGDNIDAVDAQLYRPCGIALDNSGNLYIADAYNNRIRKVVAAPPVFEMGGQGSIKERLATGAILAAPNILDLSEGNSVAIHIRGDPNAPVEVEIYDEVGDFIGSLAAVLDWEGFGQAVIQGGRINGRVLGPGAYWALVKGGGVNDKKRFMIAR